MFNLVAEALSTLLRKAAN
jgi:hypothetical protein